MVDWRDWMRIGLCTALGLVVIGVAAVHPDPEPEPAASTLDPDETSRA